MKTKLAVRSVLLVLGWLVLVITPVFAQEQPRPGGVLKVAMIGEPPSLDLQSTTAVITQQITWHIYETLYTYDKAYSPIPFLAQVDLQVLDWATLVQRRNKPELFDVFSTGFSFNADPALATSLQCA